MKSFIAVAIFLLVSVAASTYSYADSDRAERLSQLLGEAIQSGQVSEVKSIIGNGADVNLAPAGSISLLEIAVIYGNEEIIGYLIEAGADVNGSEGNAKSPLMLAPSPAVAELLIEAGAELGPRGSRQRTPLHELESEEVVQVLLDAGAVIDQRDSDGHTPLDLAARDNNVPKVATLLAGGAKINVIDLEERWSVSSSPSDTLALAAKNGSTEAIILLLEVAKYEPESLVEALGAAVGRGHVDIVELLLDSGADPNSKRFGSPVLISAAREGRVAVVSMLLKSGANVNYAPQGKDRALTWAARRGHAKVVQVLLDAGADLDDPNDPEAFAASYVHNDMADRLKALEVTGDENQKSARQSPQDARQQDSQAQAEFDLGIVYYRGLGVSKDFAKAALWFKRAAEKEHVLAQFNIGLMYANGQGVSADLKQAERWYQRAAEQGYGSALNNLGAMYISGEGVPQDRIRGIVYYAEAARAGNTRSPDNIENNLSYFTRRRIGVASANIRSGASKDHQVIATPTSGSSIFVLETVNDWHRVYYRPGYTVGWISEAVLERSVDATRLDSQESPQFPPAPASRAGHTTCSTRCVNGDCYRTYSDGRRVRFQAQRKFNPVTSQWEWDSGGC